MSSPNIIYIHSHDTGRYIEPYGHAVSTPGLQRLAEEGVLFRQAFTVNPTCSPSRAALVTGTWPHENGMVGLAHRGFALKDYDQHIVNLLKRHGYHTALAGVQHVAHGGDKEPWETIGYDQYLGHAGEADVKAAEFLDKAPDQPFFLAVGFNQTHRVFPEETPNEDPRYCLPPAPLPDTPQTRLDMARYKESVRILDRKMTTVFDAVDRNGLGDNTLVICTTDHGIAFPRMKCNLQDSGTGIMLIMRGPGGFGGGKVVDAMVTHLDIFPTVCDVSGIPAPGGLRGTSLVPLVNGRQECLHEAIFTEVNYHAAYEPMRAVRTDRFKYIRRFDGRDRPVLCNCDNSPSKSLWVDAGWGKRNPDREALYDLVFDPNECCNLVADPGHTDILAEMRDKLERWMRNTSDPLLEKGAVSRPAGTFVNDPDDISPKMKPPS